MNMSLGSLERIEIPLPKRLTTASGDVFWKQEILLTDCHGVHTFYAYVDNPEHVVIALANLTRADLTLPDPESADIGTLDSLGDAPTTDRVSVAAFSGDSILPI